MLTQPPKPSDLSDGAHDRYPGPAYHERAALAAGRTKACASTHRADGDRRGESEGAPPSNTAPDNSNQPFFKALRWGVDSLYLSYPGELSSRAEAQLNRLKQHAQSSDPRVQAAAQLPLDDHIFEVRDKGASLFPYILEDGAFRIQLARPSKTVPMAYVKLSSTYLAHVSPVEAEDKLAQVLSELGDLHAYPNVSRIDLCVDFVSSVDMESWGRDAWVTRASSINAYSVKGCFTGWSVGLGGVMAARLYDKTLEIKTSDSDYLYELWQRAGWDGVSPVWRLEFQFKRDVLTQHALSKLDPVLAHLNGLWSYATTEWLRLTLPNPDDKTRSRWPLHPLWGYLSSIDWETSGGPLTREFSPTRLPSDDWLFAQGLSPITTFMAWEGITDFQLGQAAFFAALHRHHTDKAFRYGMNFPDYIAEKVALKARRFNTMLNPSRDAESARAEWENYVEAYRRESDGG